MEINNFEFIDYLFIDFIKITDVDLIDNYRLILDSLKPLKEIDNPNYKWYKKHPKKLQITPLMELSFGDVISIRTNLQEATIDNVVECICIVTKLKNYQVKRFTITQFYGIINGITEQLEQIISMEYNELSDDEDDVDLIATNANERMARFGTINTIDSLAGGDLIKWAEVEKLPYLSVFTKLKMDKERNKIHKEISELQRKRLKQ